MQRFKSKERVFFYHDGDHNSFVNGGLFSRTTSIVPGNCR